MKKAVKYIVVSLLLAFCVALSGCINLQAGQYQTSSGVTMLLYRDGEDYFAQIIVVATSVASSESEADKYLFDLLSTQFETRKEDDYPVSQVLIENGRSATQFTYFCKINNDSWITSTQRVEYGFLTAKVTVEDENPFADAYKSGTELNNIYNLIKNGRVDLSFNKHFGGTNIDSVNTKMLWNCRTSTDAVTGNVVYDEGAYYYQTEGVLSETKEGGTGNRIQYTFKAMVSYGWFTLAIVIGLATVGGILLFAKKKDGKKIDLTNRGPFVSNRDDFGAYGGSSYPFEGFGGPGQNGESGFGNDRKNGKGGSPFDGF